LYLLKLINNKGLTWIFFQYTVAIKKIDTLTTKKAREQMIREIVEQLNTLDGNNYSSSYSFNLNTGKLDETIRYYKVATKILNSYTSKHLLPQFITNRIRLVQLAIANYLVNNTSDFEFYAKAFEFDKIVEIYNYSLDPETFKSLALLVGNNKLNFELKFTLSASRAFVAFTENFILSEVYTIEEIKQNLPNAIRYTVLEDRLDKLYSRNYETDTTTLNNIIISMHKAIDTTNAKIVKYTAHTLPLAA